ncbi:MAG: helix-hairpin-helix domain-containing protein [Flavobacteriaceae bacterium]|nr:helix-hairpin-helix domain-containing protein [Flavobacteriaceae bacterium]
MPIKRIPLRFSHQQRNGIFLLLFLIIGSEYLYYKLQNRIKPFHFDLEAQAAIQQKIDSVKAVRLQESQPKIYPFNPNFITDFKGYTLGMTNEEIDRLMAYRKKGLWVNSANDFQKVTGVSDSLLKQISPFFKFPDWISNPKPPYSYQPHINGELSFTEKRDLNTATVSDLQLINGVGEVLSNRIIRFRDSFEGGFIHALQLQDVYGLSTEVIERIENRFTVKTPRNVQKVNINSAKTEQLVLVQHIDYELAYEIIRQRTLREGFSSWDELTKVKGFPQSKIAIIQLYLSLD